MDFRSWQERTLLHRCWIELNFWVERLKRNASLKTENQRPVLDSKKTIFIICNRFQIDLNRFKCVKKKILDVRIWKKLTINSPTLALTELASWKKKRFFLQDPYNQTGWGLCQIVILYQYFLVDKDAIILFKKNAFRIFFTSTYLISFFDLLAGTGIVCFFVLDLEMSSYLKIIIMF